jgi:aerobic carbon-monoxide dehydrogenase medium subunit
MKPVAFQLETAQTVDDALELLSRDGREVKVLAGGQSLVPLLNFRLARPDVLVDINPVRELHYIREVGGGLAIGAMTRLHALELSAEVGRLAPLVAEALPSIAHAPIRNRGTFGGSLAHADPAAELCTVALALDATIVARRRQGERSIPIDELFIGPFTTSLRRDELLTEIRLPVFPAGAGWAFEEVARRRGDFAMVAVAAVVQVDSDLTVTDARLAYTSMGPTPMRARKAEAELIGLRATRDTFAQVAEMAIGELEPGDDLHASQEYRVHVGKALTSRALQRALDRAHLVNREHG